MGDNKVKNGSAGPSHPAPLPPDSKVPFSPVLKDELRGECPIDLLAWDPVKITSDDHLKAQVEKARKAQERWVETPFEERAEALKAAAKEMLRQRGQVIDYAKMELGKLEVDRLFTEGLGPLDNISGWIRLIKKHSQPQKVRLNPVSFPKKRARIDMIARGVVGVIAPWNFPVSGLYRSLFPALLTGNAVLLKPSEFTPRTSGWLAEKLAAHLPEGLIQTVQGGGATGAALIESGIDACVFTGSVATGRKVEVRCAELGIPCSVEMGGNDAAIVLHDCDLTRTAAGITHWALQNSGQSCGAIELCYVDSRIADRFVERLSRAFEKLRCGSGPIAEVDISPVAHRGQLEIVKKHVADAVSKGAEIRAGGEALKEGLWYPPTLLDHCTEDMQVVKEETFGPILAIVRVDGPAEAIRRVNAGRYGLGASIWTQDIDRAERLADRLDVGVVTVNNHSMTGAIPDLPWSGTRDTGNGVANSIHSLKVFVRPKTILIDENKDPELFWMPFDRELYQLGDLLADAQLFRVERAWKLPLLIRNRLRKVRSFFS